MVKQEKTAREIDSEIDGLTTGINIFELLIHDPDLDPIGADLARFYAAKIRRRRQALVTLADVLEIAAADAAESGPSLTLAGEQAPRACQHMGEGCEGCKCRAAEGADDER